MRKIKFMLFFDYAHYYVLNLYLICQQRINAENIIIKENKGILVVERNSRKEWKDIVRSRESLKLLENKRFLVESSKGV